MKRRNFLKVVTASVAGLFGVKPTKEAVPVAYPQKWHPMLVPNELSLWKNCYVHSYSQFTKGGKRCVEMLVAAVDKYDGNLLEMRKRLLATRRLVNSWRLTPTVLHVHQFQSTTIVHWGCIITEA